MLKGLCLPFTVAACSCLSWLAKPRRVAPNVEDKILQPITGALGCRAS